jgi:hypothetical protein
MSSTRAYLVYLSRWTVDSESGSVVATILNQRLLSVGSLRRRRRRRRRRSHPVKTL